LGFLFLGLIFVGAGFGFWVKSLLLVRRGLRTSAVVIGFRQERVADGAVQYAVVEFTDASGNLQRAELQNTSGPVGRRLKIIYHPKWEDYAIEDSFSRLWIFPGLILFMGGASIMTVGAIALVYNVELTGP
jgi:hypothetical protein